MVTESRSYRASLKEVYDASVDALRKCGFEVKDRKENSIRATSGFSLRSWGENVEIILIHHNEGVEVRVSSLPAGQLFDWGKSYENVSRILADLDLRLSRRK